MCELPQNVDQFQRYLITTIPLQITTLTGFLKQVYAPKKIFP